MIEALRSGHLGGAYLDVFEKEPLPTEAPLWNLPNVLISPHNSAAASGNDERFYQMLLDNLEHWQHK
jgi:D-2-hydroxyacid dehydrogenase (NADP+)